MISSSFWDCDAPTPPALLRCCDLVFLCGGCCDITARWGMRVRYSAECYFTFGAPCACISSINYGITGIIHGRVPHVSYHCGNEKLSERYVYLDALDIFSRK